MANYRFVTEWRLHAPIDQVFATIDDVDWLSVTVTAAIDTVDITRAQYATDRSQLTVQATDSNSTAKLTVSVTSSGAILGPMRGNGTGGYTAKFSGIANPVNITVTSNLGGSDSAAVRAR